MAKQTGIIPIKGTIGNITFFKSKDGDMVRKKGSISASAIANSPAFQRTRENNAEFGRAGKASKVLRTALNTLLQQCSDHRMVSRLTTAMLKVIQADATSARGLRNVIDGEAALLTGFDFNINAVLSSCLTTIYTAAINRVTGELTVNIPAFKPRKSIKAPAGATHFKIISGGTAIDFENGFFETDTKETDYLPWNAADTAIINLANTVTANSTHPLFLVLGVEFFQQINGQQYPLNNGSFNALAIVKVDTGV
jgi:hypothetical protein